MTLVPRFNAIGISLIVLLAGCAKRFGSPTETSALVHESARKTVHGSSSALGVPRSPTVASARTCRSRGAGFELSLVAGFTGAADPIAAARSFVRRGGVAGFGTPTSVWVIADPSRIADGDATLIDGRASLHAVRMPNRTWAIDEGRRCV